MATTKSSVRDLDPHPSTGEPRTPKRGACDCCGGRFPVRELVELLEDFYWSFIKPQGRVDDLEEQLAERHRGSGPRAS